MEEVFKDAFVL